MLQVAKYRNVTLAAVVLIVATCALYFWNDRSDFPMIMGLYAVGFLSYLFLIHDKRVSFQALLLIAISLHIMALFASPNLSPDSYRFLWDGAITWMGNNPYNATPNELMEQQTFYNSPYFQELYHGLSAISQRNHSCYPTVHQFYFLLATSVSSSVYVQTVLLKLLLLCTQGVGIFFLWKLLRHFELPEKRIFLLVLNPLWLIETMGNIHFEGVMLTFLIIGLYFLVIKKWFLGALFLALAVHVKLIPIVLFPFLLRYLGWKRSIVIYIVSLMLVIVLATAYLRPENLLLFWDSLQLYFKSFKFNAFIYHYFIHYGHSLYGYYPIRTYGFILTQWSLFLILCLSFFGGRLSFQQMIIRMVFGLLIYYLFATTVHPWYIVPIIGLSLFTEYSFPIIWSGLIMMSYAAYSHFDAYYVQLIILMEYIVLLGFVTYELIRRRPVLPFMKLS